MDYLKYLEVRQNTVDICFHLSEEEMSCQPRKEVSPPKWHLGHTTWFFEKIILESNISNYKSFDSNYDFYFNSYYKQVGLHIEQSKRDSIELKSDEILSYRKYVDEKIEELLETTNDKEIANLINLGLNHEEQHQELLHMDIKAIKIFFGENIITDFFSTNDEKENGEEWFEICEKIEECGHLGESFAYDNEGPRHKVYMYPALVNKNLVRNIDYAEFISSGGYQNSKYWLSKGWEWVEENKISAPLYWNEKLKANDPVAHISYFEADAFANWSGLRLPTEYECEIFDREVNKKSPLWCWTSSQYSAYPRFKKFDGSLSEYNGKFMCNQFVLRGGCVATPKGHLRYSYRNFYEPQQRWMFSGIRLAKDTE